VEIKALLEAGVDLVNTTDKCARRRQFNARACAACVCNACPEARRVPGGGSLRWGFTALHKAAQRGQHWVVKVLLERPEALRLSKAVVRLGGSTPLLLAVEKGLLPESPPALPALCGARNRRARARGGRAPRGAPAMHQVPSRGVPRPRAARSPRSLLLPDCCSRPSALRSAVPPTRAALRADAGVHSRLGRRR
jgi:hypothetical protein